MIIAVGIAVAKREYVDAIMSHRDEYLDDNRGQILSGCILNEIRW